MATKEDMVRSDESHEPPAKRRRLSNDGDSSSAIATSAESNPMDVYVAEEQRKEHQVGIRAFVNSNAKTFTGILKVRYSDFIVNEILPSGEVVHLHDTRAPKTGRQQGRDEVEAQTEDAGHEGGAAKGHDRSKEASTNGHPKAENELPEVSDEQKSKLVELLNETAAGEILALYESIRAQPGARANDHPQVRTAFTSDRSVRGQIHQYIRETFKSTIESSTDKEGVLVLTATRSTGRGKQGNTVNGWHSKPNKSNKVSWTERGGDYVHFTLYKENKDTMEAISWLVKQLKCNAKNFQFAGTKDRRAITSQRVSAYRIEAERLAAQNRTLRGSKVGDFAYHSQGLELGDLSGNEFVITLRDFRMSGIDTSTLALDSLRFDLQERMQSLHSNGYLNYYGQQRFGTFSMRTDIIGRYILQEDFKGACDAILAFQPSALEAAQAEADNKNPQPTSTIGQDDKSRALAIHTWRQTNRINSALDILPRKFSAEAQLIRALTRNPHDYLGALMQIQRNLRLMYVHAYQSYVWNLAATHRITTYGTSVVAGDLVLVNEHKDKQATTPTQPEPAALDAEGDVIIQPAADDRATDRDDVFERARPLTDAEAASGRYSLFDVVLPQPGYDILYPSNETGTFYKTFMVSEDGGSLDPDNMRRKQRDFSLSGSYRKMLARIGAEFAVDVKCYERDEEQFVKTDGQVLEEKVRAREGNGEGEVEKKAEAGSKVAVVLKFQLGSSQYATMALRELSRGGVVPHKQDFSGGR